MTKFKVNAYSGEESLTKLINISKLSNATISTGNWPGPLILNCDDFEADTFEQLIIEAGLEIIERIKL